MMAKNYAFARNFFSILNISNIVVKTPLKNQGNTGSFTGQDMGGKHSPKNKTSEARIGSVKHTLKAFQQLNHITLVKIHNGYILIKFDNSKMHRLYVEQCETSDSIAVHVNEKVYRNVICNEYNLSFFKPKKDQYVTFLKFHKLTGPAKEEFKYEKSTSEERINRMPLKQQTKSGQQTTICYSQV